MDLLSDDMMASAKEAMKFFECEITNGCTHSCKLIESDDAEKYVKIFNFVNGAQMPIDMAFCIFEYFSHKMPEDELERLRWSTKEIQRKISMDFFPENELMAWGVNEGERWVDRSLRVTGDPEFNHQMHDKNGNLRLKNIFVHANHQYIYHCVLDVLEFLKTFKP